MMTLKLWIFVMWLNRLCVSCHWLFPDLFLRFQNLEGGLPTFVRRPSIDTLALAMCDPGLKRRDSSECEVDSLPEFYMDSGLSTLRGSHEGYDSEQEVKGQEEEEEEQRGKKEGKQVNNDSMMEENSDTEVRNKVILCFAAITCSSKFCMPISATSTKPLTSYGLHWFQSLIRCKLMGNWPYFWLYS